MTADIPSDLTQEKTGFLGKSGVLVEHLRARLLAIKPVGALRTILLLALFQVLVLFVVSPPWWHYDEPGHFEYVWLAAHSPTWPVVGQYDESMRRELGLSLQQYGWYAIRNYKLDLNSTKRIWIGTAQVGDKPGYYFLASLPLRLMPNAPIIVQYYAARSVSLLLFLLIIVCVWHALGEILPRDHPLRWMTTAFVALLPAFADEMASVNNDVSAVLAASLFLWAALRLIRRGFSIRRLLFLAVSLAACYLSKNTAVFAFVLVPIVLVLALLRGKSRILAWIWGTAAVAVVAVAVLGLKWGGPLGWYRPSVGDYPLRVQAKDAPLGNYVFELKGSKLRTPTQLMQVMPQNEAQPLGGKTMTLGAWIWANQPTQTAPAFMAFYTGKNPVLYTPHDPVNITTTPTFFAVTFVVPQNVDHAALRISRRGPTVPGINVFLDGLVLVPGTFGSTPPSFTDANGTRGTWNGQAFVNLVRNGSAEQASFQLRSWLSDNRIGRSLHNSMSNPFLFLATLQDWAGTSQYYLGVGGVLFRTFWASLAGDKAFLRSGAVSGLLQVLTVLGVAGVPVWLWKRRRRVDWNLVGFLGIALVLPWLVVIIRGASTFFNQLLVLSWARYAFPGILPTALALCTGWLAWLELLSARLKLKPDTSRAIFLSLMLGISAFAILNAIQVLHRAWWNGWMSLLLLFLFAYVSFHWTRRLQTRPGSQTPPPDGAGTA